MAHANQPEESLDLMADVVADGASRTAGPSSVVEGLFRAHSRRVRNFLGFRLRDAVDGADASQDVFLKLWRKERDGDLKDEARSYLFSAAYTQAIDAKRRHEAQFRDRSFDVEVETLGSQQSSIEDTVHWRKGISHLVDSVQALPETTRKVFVLCHFKGMSYEEVAAELNICRRTVERHVAAGLDACRKQMKDYL
jgi:RNA polymerase sigma-19 factor, ECF subfamily